VERIAKTVLFDYHLEDLINYGNEDNVINEEINSRTRMFADRHDWLPGDAGKGLTSPAVFRSDVDVNGRRAPVIKETLLVKRNSVYVLTIFQYIPRPGAGNEVIPLHSLELTSFPDHVTTLVPKQQVVGKYDRLEFDIKVLSLGPGERTALAIPYQPDAATTATAEATIYLPLSTAESRHGGLVAALTLAIVSLFFMFKPEIGSLSQEVVRNLATVIFVLTVSGPSRTLASIWPAWPWGAGQ
jgi:hypothetical protein